MSSQKEPAQAVARHRLHRRERQSDGRGAAGDSRRWTRPSGSSTSRAMVSLLAARDHRPAATRLHHRRGGREPARSRSRPSRRRRSRTTCSAPRARRRSERRAGPGPRPAGQAAGRQRRRSARRRTRPRHRNSDATSRKAGGEHAGGGRGAGGHGAPERQGSISREGQGQLLNERMNHVESDFSRRWGQGRRGQVTDVDGPARLPAGGRTGAVSRRDRYLGPGRVQDVPGGDRRRAGEPRRAGGMDRAGQSGREQAGEHDRHQHRRAESDRHQQLRPHAQQGARQSWSGSWSSSG